METSFGTRIKKAWNAFFSREPTIPASSTYYGGYNYRPDRFRLRRGNERTIITSIYNRIASDVASIDVRHVRLDENGRFKEEVDSNFNTCLSLSSNMDQTARAFFQDIAMSMMDEGCIAVVPVDTDKDPNDGSPGTFDILSMRVGKILSWYPDRVRLSVYNEKTGQKQEITVMKRSCAILENPFYSVMNEPNSVMQRLIRKLNLLDTIDEQNSSGKLDLIIQLPYVVNSERRRDQAEERRKAIEQQLVGSKYGIAYTDGTEHITQLNRPVENNLMAQVEYLTSMLYSQLGITQEIMNGTASETAMLNYYSRTIDPILATIVMEFRRKFLSQTARSQGQSIMYFRDPFKLVSITNIAEIADKMTRNEIMTSNEIRQVIGMKPSDDPKADELRNSNMPAQDEPENPSPPEYSSEGE